MRLKTFRTPLLYGLITMIVTLLSACSSAALTAINTPSHLFSTLSEEKDIPYGDKPYQKLDLYLPKAPGANNGTLVVFIYGGGWTTGSKEQYFFVADALTSAGYAVAIPDYIKYPQGVFPSFVEDIALSIAWLSDNLEHYTEVDNVVLMGHSAGAHTAALLLTDTRYLAAHDLQVSYITAFIGLAGPYGFTPKEKQYQAIFANMDDYTQMQPLYFVTGNEPPMLLLHGSKDTTVLPVNTRKFAEKVNGAGGTATPHYPDGQGHIAPVLALSRVYATNNAVRSEILEFLQSSGTLQDD